MTDTKQSRPPGEERDEQRAAFGRLILIVAAAVVASVASGVVATVAVVAAIILMIMLHELGHFLTAKWAGMKVTEFFLGFGPRLWSVRRGETEYGVKAIPAGGYVKIIGMSNLEEVDPADEPRTYRQQPFWRRLSVAVAGSVMHFLIAFVLMFVLFTAVGVVNYDKELPTIGTITRPESGQSPAQRAGFRVGDRILAYDGIAFEEWDDLRAYIRPRSGEPIRFEVERQGRTVTLTATPADLAALEIKGAQPPKGESYGFIGIGPDFAVERAGPIEGLGRSVGELGRASVLTVQALGSMFTPDGVASYADQLTSRRPSAAPDPDAPRFLSPVGFVKVAGQAAESGLQQVLLLLFSINIFVGIFNMIPLLPLDGGHVAIAAYERLRSRKGRPYRVDMAKLMPVTYAVFLLIVLLGVTSLYLDISQPLPNPFE